MSFYNLVDSGLKCVDVLIYVVIFEILFLHNKMFLIKLQNNFQQIKRGRLEQLFHILKEKYETLEVRIMFPVSPII